MNNRLREYCRTLRLGNLDELITEVEFENREQYVTDLLELVVKKRHAQRIQKLIRKAGFPSSKTLEGYEFAPITFPKGMDKETLLSLDFIEEKENILMLGAVGTGKTHRHCPWHDGLLLRKGGEILPDRGPHQ